MSVRVLCQFSSCLLVDCFFVHIFFSILKLMPVVYRVHADDDSKRIFLLKEGWIFLTYGLQTDRSPCWRKAAVFFLFCNSRLGSCPALSACHCTGSSLKAKGNAYVSQSPPSFHTWKTNRFLVFRIKDRNDMPYFKTAILVCNLCIVSNFLNTLSNAIAYIR